MTPQNNGMIIKQVHLEVTYRCNHSCLFCPQQSARQKQMPREIVSRLEPVLGTLEHLILAGGEVFAWPHARELVELCRNRSPEVRCSIVTNGTLFNDYWRSLVERGFFRKINVSFNASNRDDYKKIHGIDHFERALEAIDFLSQHRKSANMTLESSFVFSKSSSGSLADYVRLMNGRVDKIVLQELGSYSSIKEYFELERITDDVVPKLLSEIQECLRLCQPGPTRFEVMSFTLPGLHASKCEASSPPSTPPASPASRLICPLPWREIMISASGDVTLGCCNTEKHLGNVLQEPIDTLIQKPVVARVQQAVLSGDIDGCASPRLKHKCPYIKLNRTTL